MEYRRNGWGTDDRFTGGRERTTKDDGIVQQVCSMASPGHAGGVLCADADPVGGDCSGAGAVDNRTSRAWLRVMVYSGFVGGFRRPYLFNSLCYALLASF